MGGLCVVLDVETTGLGHFHKPPRPDGVVQVAYAARDPHTGEVEVWKALCDPGYEHYAGGRAAEAFKVNRLTPERLALARGADEVAGEMRARLAALEARCGPLELRAYNMSFDQPFLTSAPWSLPHSWGRCLMVEAQERLGFRPKLAQACENLKVRWPEGAAHDAGVDAHAALLLAEALRGEPTPLAVVR